MNKRENHILGYAFAAPAITIISIFVIFATLFAVYMSFFNYDFLYNGGVEKTFLGFENYKYIFEDPKFQAAMRNTVAYVVMVVPIQIVMSLFLANTLTKNIKGTKLFRMIFFLPMITASTAISMIFMFLFSVNGPVNEILMSIGTITEPINFLADQEYARKLVAITHTWAAIPYTTIILIAAMSDVSSEVYEAADIDGASSRLKFFKITIPGIKPALIFAITIATVSAMQLFDQIYIMTGGSGGPDNATLSLPILIYNYAFDPAFSSMGYACALSVLLGIIIFIITIIIRRFDRKD